MGLPPATEQIVTNFLLRRVRAGLWNFQLSNDWNDSAGPSIYAILRARFNGNYIHFSVTIETH